jgi:hypothetical protein
VATAEKQNTDFFSQSPETNQSVDSGESNRVIPNALRTFIRIHQLLQTQPDLTADEKINRRLAKELDRRWVEVIGQIPEEPNPSLTLLCCEILIDGISSRAPKSPVDTLFSESRRVAFNIKRLRSESKPPREKEEKRLTAEGTFIRSYSELFQLTEIARRNKALTPEQKTRFRQAVVDMEAAAWILRGENAREITEIAVNKLKEYLSP